MQHDLQVELLGEPAWKLIHACVTCSSWRMMETQHEHAIVIGVDVSCNPCHPTLPEFSSAQARTRFWRWRPDEGISKCLQKFEWQSEE